MSDAHNLLYRAGLLAGLGARADAAVEAVLAPTAAAGARSCIDGGAELLLTLRAPGPRALRVMRRSSGDETHQLWRSWCGAQAVADVQLLGAVVPASLATLPDHPRHQALARQAQLYRRERPQVAGERHQDCWVGYRLNRQPAPDALLASLGLHGAWSTTHALWERLLGRGLPERSRPWSLVLPLDPEADSRVRIASTLWAHQPEDDDKHQRLARLVDELGGDAAFAQALYKLLRGAGQRTGRAAIVGAAMELTLNSHGELLAADFVLRPAAHPFGANHA